MKKVFRFYSQYTDAANYKRITITKQPDGTFTVAVETAGQSK